MKESWGTGGTCLATGTITQNRADPIRTNRGEVSNLKQWKRGAGGPEQGHATVHQTPIRKSRAGRRRIKEKCGSCNFGGGNIRGLSPTRGMEKHRRARAGTGKGE